MIRPAEKQDISRIAEILIFAKRCHYREIFQNDAVTFGEMLVYPLAQSYLDHPEQLEGMWVYDDGFVKGMLRLSGEEIVELYVDPFFEQMGIGSSLIDCAIKKHSCRFLWVLEKNTNAIRFYQARGFALTDERKPEPGTTEYIVKMKR